ncbi:PEP/pyruvate-binding domain-containing protein [Acidipropionibacterium virtanenii]|nr:PEP/pyruvate-binding domain-containing protein [Acidipropionibacterium virtanenii]
MIVWFDEIRAADTELVGGKAANLGECARSGLPVLPGFCLSTEAYREATAAIAEELVADVTREDPASARQRILNLALPASVEAAIRDACARLGGGPMAVRSSATAEDLAGASFAGQQDTYLGMRGATPSWTQGAAPEAGARYAFALMLATAVLASAATALLNRRRHPC